MKSTFALSLALVVLVSERKSWGCIPIDCFYFILTAVHQCCSVVCLRLWMWPNRPMCFRPVPCCCRMHPKPGLSLPWPVLWMLRWTLCHQQAQDLVIMASNNSVFSNDSLIMFNLAAEMMTAKRTFFTRSVSMTDAHKHSFLPFVLCYPFTK